MSNYINGLILGLLLLSPVHAESVTLEVLHDHDPWGSCAGTLTISEEGIRFQSDEDEHNRQWSWLDIQTVDRSSETRFSILTYKDQTLLLGRDQPFDFTVQPNGRGLDAEAFGLIKAQLTRPVVDRIAREVDSEYEVPVKHLHTFGGCEGQLRFGPEWIVYETNHEKDARSWRRSAEVVNVWSVDRYDIEIEVRENVKGDLLRTRRFHFQLKEPLNQDYYSKLRRELLPQR